MLSLSGNIALWVKHNSRYQEMSWSTTADGICNLRPLQCVSYYAYTREIDIPRGVQCTADDVLFGDCIPVGGGKLCRIGGGMNLHHVRQCDNVDYYARFDAAAVTGTASKTIIMYLWRLAGTCLSTHIRTCVRQYTKALTPQLPHTKEPIITLANNSQSS